MRSPKGIIWNEDENIGRYPVPMFRGSHPYDKDYFSKYSFYAQTDLGIKLDTARMLFVDRHLNPGATVVDVGVGCGNFINVRNRAQSNTFGYDINPAAVKWLAENGLWWDPWQFDMLAATFWDSLEHFSNPADILRRVAEWAFISIPIFKDPKHADQSKHFRPDEHFWYFTHEGLIDYMVEHGFQLVESNRMEIALGREDIHTFAFKRL